MSTQIWKFRIPVDGITVDLSRPTPMFVGCDPRSSSIDDEDLPSIWIKCHSDGIPTRRRYYLVGTGHSIPPGNDRYCGSAVCGSYVWHVFESEKP